MALICPHIHASTCLSFIPPELTEHQLCEPLIIKDLLAKEQIRAPSTKMVVGHQATGWLMMEVVFSFQQGICYSYSFSLFLYSIEKFENVYTITKYTEVCCGHNVCSWFHVLKSSITCLALSKYFYLGNCGEHSLFASWASPVQREGRRLTLELGRTGRRQLRYPAENSLSSARWIDSRVI